MEFFIDTANLEHIEETLKKGFLPIFSATPTINTSQRELAL